MIRLAVPPMLRLAAVAIVFCMAGTAARAETEAEALVTEARLTVDRLMADKEFFELPKFIKAAKGILIVPQLVKGGFIIGAEGGSGVFLARGTDGSWSPPAFYTLRSDEHTSELQSLMRISYAVFCLNKKIAS